VHADQHVTQDFLAPKQAATFVGRSPKTLERWRAERTGPPWVKFGLRGVLYRTKDIIAWAERCTVGGAK
jgi:predicted DNA-binding transcriptional regulator AlpA